VQLGDGTSANRSAPVRVTGLANAIDVAAGEFFSMAVTADGSVWTWGNSNFGELGRGTPEPSPTPVRATISGVTAISAGARHALALKGDGTVWAWGDNHAGQLGDGTTTNRSIPVPVAGLAGVRQVSGGGAHSVALLGDGTVRAWGRNAEGQLGDGTTTDRATQVTCNRSRASRRSRPAARTRSRVVPAPCTRGARAGSRTSPIARWPLRSAGSPVLSR
jgi:alpha-tubulin suppressor-like RCC1 family protein